MTRFGYSVAHPTVSFVDMHGTRLLDFPHFVDRGARRIALPPAWPAVLLALASVGCAGSSSPGSVEDTETSGRIHVVSAYDAERLTAVEIQSFLTTYHEAGIDSQPATSSDEAVAALYGGKADLIAIGRELEPVERSMALKCGLELEGYRIAHNAIVLVVHASNPVNNLSLDEARRVWTGEISNWSALGGSNQTIVPVVLSPEDDRTRTIVQQVMQGDPMRAPSVRAESDSAVLAQVRARPGGFGYVSLRFAGAPGVKALDLAAMSGLSYTEPGPETVYGGTYPLTRYLNFFVRSSGPRLANGLVTYATSQDGQRRVQELGLVPTSVPVRFVHRSPMLGTH